MSYAFGAITLSDVPSYPLDPDGESDDILIATPTDAGYVVKRPRFTRTRRTWGLNFIGLPDTDVANLKTYERVTLHNRVDPLSWAHPVAGVFNVQIAVPIKYSRPGGANQSTVKIMLQEV